MPRKIAIAQKPKNPSARFEIDRTYLNNRAQTPEKMAMSSPIYQYIMWNVKRRHPNSPSTVDRYIAALILMPNSLLDRIAECADKLARQGHDKEDVWIDTILDPISCTDDFGTSHLREDIDEFDAIEIKSAAEHANVKAFARLGIEAVYTGQYSHDGDCKGNGSCCLDIRPAQTQTDEETCVMGKRHHMTTTQPPALPAGNSTFMYIDETCLRCGIHRTVNGRNDRLDITYHQRRKSISVGLTAGPAIIVTGAPGIEMIHINPPAAFSALVNVAFPDRAITTMEGRDVSNLTCDKCEMWVGDPNDPDISHLSSDHSRKCTDIPGATA
ncbi:MAG: hypothetical protein OXC95_18690 [Dehalococcoidia bacterium]|nr:hypothetical protein [Dehalococcoidia bacterium]